MILFVASKLTTFACICVLHFVCTLHCEHTFALEVFPAETRNLGHASFSCDTYDTKLTFFASFIDVKRLSLLPVSSLSRRGHLQCRATSPFKSSRPMKVSLSPSSPAKHKTTLCLYFPAEFEHSLAVLGVFLPTQHPPTRSSLTMPSCCGIACLAKRYGPGSDSQLAKHESRMLLLWLHSCSVMICLSS